jgi:hypothetical protein
MGTRPFKTETMSTARVPKKIVSNKNVMVTAKLRNRLVFSDLMAAAISASAAATSLIATPGDEINMF